MRSRRLPLVVIAYCLGYSWLVLPAAAQNAPEAGAGSSVAAAALRNAEYPRIRELTVSGQASAWAPPVRARITLALEATGANARAAAETLAELERAVRAQLPSSAQSVVLARGQTFAGSGQKAHPPKRGETVRLRRFLGIETAQLADVFSILDSGLKSGAAEVTEVEYLTDPESPALVEAGEKAVAVARRKAEQAARKLGMTLGEPLSVLISEESQGASLRARLQQGPLPDYAELNITVYATASFELIPTK